MFRDARGIQNGSSVETDLCIIGGGAAGITLALGAKEAGFSTLVVEAGGFDFDDETQAVYSGTVVSDVLPPAYLWTSRLRQVGGTTNHWGGHSVVINANIFGSRAGVPGGQWPFGSDELRPYYVRAAEILKKREGVREQWRPQAEAGLVPMERYAGSTVAENRLGPAYRQELEEARLQVLLHGSVTGLNFAPSPTRVGSVTVQTLAGNFFFVAGRVFVLATGAVENARLLLLPAPSHARGIGNGSDHVGRYFADHLFKADRILETSPFLDGRNGPFFTFTPELQAEHAIPEIGFIRRPHGRVPPGPTATLSAVAGLLEPSAHQSEEEVTYYIEPLPERDNRVVLSDERDPFGQPRCQLHFRVSPDLRAGFARAVELLARLVGQHGIGRVSYHEPPEFHYGSHHMCTTRMSADSTQGVVDENCKVHAVANLFVAGSSVFPSAGCGNPTFPLVALAARLADHLVDGIERRAFD